MVARQFHRARRQAALESLLARLSGHSAELLSYDEVVGKLGVAGQSPGGVRQIPIAAIVGSVGRYGDFSRTFLPRQESDEDRWVSVGAAAPTVSDLPPIEVYKVGESYFVLDGNHRVSIAHRQGLDYIDARITEVRTRVPLPPGAKPDALIIAAEYSAFLAYTQLDVSRPNLDLQVSVPGQYRHLENHIEAWRYLRETAEARDIPLQEAAVGWYDESYLPLVRAIREQGILRYFPGRTETDFFVWLARHRAELQNQLGWAITPDVAVSRLLARAREDERSQRRLSGAGLRRLTQLVAPEQPPTRSWAGDRTLARYSDHLFASVLTPYVVIRLNGAPMPDENALAVAASLCRAEKAQLHVLCAINHDPDPTETQAIEALRGFIQHQSLKHDYEADVDVETTNATERTLALAYLHDLVVIDRRFGARTWDEPPPTMAVRRIVRAAHRPVLIPGERADEMPPAHVLLVHDTRRPFDESVFIAAYLAERWQARLTALPIANNRNTEGVVGRIDDYFKLHEVEACFLAPARPGVSLPAVVLEAAADAGCDLILLPAPSGRHNNRRLDLSDAIFSVIQHWPQSILIAS